MEQIFCHCLQRLTSSASKYITVVNGVTVQTLRALKIGAYFSLHLIVEHHDYVDVVFSNMPSIAECDEKPQDFRAQLDDE